MNRRAKYLAVGLIIGLGAIGAAIMFVLNPPAGLRYNDEKPEPSRPAAFSNSDKASLFRDFSTERYTDDGELAFRLKIGECELRPRTVLSGKLGFAKVAKMSDVHLDFFHWPQTNQADSSTASVAVSTSGQAERGPPKTQENGNVRTGVTSRSGGIASAGSSASGSPQTDNSMASVGVAALADVVQHVRRLPGWESVNGVDIRDVSVNVYESSNLVTAVNAQRLLPGPGGKVVLEKNVTITADGGRRQLTSDKVVWWLKSDRFAVGGRYTLNDMGRNVQGARTIFDMKLEPITNNAEVSKHEQRSQHRSEAQATE